ncbi:thermonuclease family protein [Asticcacaulis tiandongensis]|uniref:thermonuclease family protein n=1 Tax=Asticcacaulis tiandongensis TaxID=2565365 RepID=UPI001128D946|nr:thermonuclease family protein [Asticcacaulis tiandongensis]
MLAIGILLGTFWLDYRSGLFGPDKGPVVSEFSGPADIIDGDSLRVAGKEVRLKGIDAFEYRQMCGVFRCGGDATLALKTLTHGKTVTCEDKGRDRYQRVLAYCRTEAGDLGEALIAAGLAVRYYDSANRYGRSEREARHEERGAWAHDFIPPSEYRRQSY